jgi:uncharacterized protein YigE (DUF2233 family)
MKWPLERFSAFALALLLVASGCASEPERGGQALATPGPPPTLMPTPTGAPPLPATPQPPTAPPADTGWLAAAPGVELRRMQVPVGEQVAPVSVARLDPGLVRLAVGYAPEAPLALSAWAGEAGAVAAINGGFFDEAGRSVSLLVHEGQAIGASYEGRGGMFAVTPEGQLWLRGLADAPYDPAEPVAEALQGWPMLVHNGGEVAYTYEDGERDRRSALALDGSGRLLLIAAPTAAFTLRELASWVAGSDLGVTAALNLDGGSSTGLIVQSESAPERITPFAPLPIVLLALPR